MSISIPKFGSSSGTQAINNLKQVRSQRAAGLPVPTDSKLADTAKAAGILGPTPKDVLNPTEKSVNRLVQSSHSANVEARTEIQQLSSELKRGKREVDNLKGILKDTGATLQDASSLYQEIDQTLGGGILSSSEAGSVLSGLANTLSGSPKRSKEKPTLKHPAANLTPRVPWELTSLRRTLLGLAPVSFYVNPSRVSMKQSFVEALDLVQGGYFRTTWKDPRTLEDPEVKLNSFPALFLDFTFQSANILTSSFNSMGIPQTKKTSGLIDQIKEIFSSTDSSKQDNLKLLSDITMPPGLRNFLDIVSLMHEPDILDSAKMLKGAAEETQTAYDGYPNFLYLRMSTMAFPKMFLKGYLTSGWSLEEVASNPFNFETPLSFMAISSDPAWWDVDAIVAAYKDFWLSNQTAEQKASQAESDDYRYALDSIETLAPESADSELHVLTTVPQAEELEDLTNLATPVEADPGIPDTVVHVNPAGQITHVQSGQEVTVYLDESGNTIDPEQENPHLSSSDQEALALQDPYKLAGVASVKDLKSQGGYCSNTVDQDGTKNLNIFLPGLDPTKVSMQQYPNGSSMMEKTKGTSGLRAHQLPASGGELITRVTAWTGEDSYTSTLVTTR